VVVPRWWPVARRSGLTFGQMLYLNKEIKLLLLLLLLLLLWIYIITLFDVGTMASKNCWGVALLLSSTC